MADNDAPPPDDEAAAAAAGNDDAPSERRPRRDRARRRAIRAHAARAGIAYSVAARQLAGAAIGPGETLASWGRTVYPVDVNDPPRWSLAGREQRCAADKLDDARRASRLPDGRAGHLVDRFPPGNGRAGACYAGEGRADVLSMVYLVVAHEAPGLVPAPLDLAWTAELGEETAVDTVCAEVDRAARQVLDDGPAGRWRRVEQALLAAQHHGDDAVRYAADRLTLAWRRFALPVEGADGEPYVLRVPWRGVRQILDALLVIADDGHAPGTRTRLAGRPGGVEGTVLGAVWGPGGPRVAYDVRLDTEDATRRVRPEELVILPNQESGAAVLQA